MSGVLTAIKKGDLNLVKKLIIKENIKDLNPLFNIACSYGNLEIAKLLLDKGAKITDYQCKAFRVACSYGQLDVVKWLVDLGIDIHVDNDCGLKWAIGQKRHEVVNFLTNKIILDKLKNDNWS